MSIEGDGVAVSENGRLALARRSVEVHNHIKPDIGLQLRNLPKKQRGMRRRTIYILRILRRRKRYRGRLDIKPDVIKDNLYYAALRLTEV